MTPKHRPVLLAEVVRLLDPKIGESYLDLTAGYGGHAAKIASVLGPAARLVLVDQDQAATDALKQQFADGQAEIWQTNYLAAAKALQQAGEQFDLILLDLGVSSPQLDDPARGFSHQASGPLDMRMDQTQDLTADRVVNDYAEDRLRQLIDRYGEERLAKRVARAIVEARPIATTGQLAKIVRQAVGWRGSNIDPATRTFQAIRIEVNDELGQLAQVLPIVVDLLGSGGRLAVISFHSLEDRLVKQFLHQASRGCICPPKQPICTCHHQAQVALLEPKAIKGSQYDVNNPRARSAKLRAAVKLKPKQKEGI